MKVQFLNMAGFDKVLFVEKADFDKAKNDENEFTSLVNAVNVYSSFFGMPYTIIREQYNAIASKLQNGGAVFFRVSSYPYTLQPLMDVFVSNNNQPKQILQMNQTAYQILQ